MSTALVRVQDDWEWRGRHARRYAFLGVALEMAQNLLARVSASPVVREIERMAYDLGEQLAQLETDGDPYR